MSKKMVLSIGLLSLCMAVGCKQPQKPVGPNPGAAPDENMDKGTGAPQQPVQQPSNQPPAKQ